jgi:hypothetical protein
MPSDSKKKEMQRKKDARTKKVTGTVKKEDEKKENGTNGVVKEMTEEETLCAKLEEEARINGKSLFLIEKLDQLYTAFFFSRSSLMYWNTRCP